MFFNWSTVAIVQLFVWLIILFEQKNVKRIKRSDKIIFAALLMLSTLLSFFTLVQIPGPITFLRYLFGSLGSMM